MLQQLALHAQKTIPATSTQDLDTRPCADNAHASVLPHEMGAIEPGENPTRMLNWKSLAFLGHIKRRTNDDRFPLPLWETWFCSSLGVPILALIGPPQQCACNDFRYDLCGDHLQTCQTISCFTGSRLGQKDDVVLQKPIEIKDYLVLQKPQKHRTIFLLLSR